MRRTTIFISMLVLLFTLSLVSCDQMFSTNLFAGLTQKKITSASVAAMTLAEIAALTASADAMKQLAADEAAKAAALAALAAAYTAAPTTAPGQQAAIAAADISIKTVPDAAQFAASAISLVTAVNFGTADAAGIAGALKGVLPADIAGALGTDPTPPQAFVDMIAAFVDASGAFDALGAGVGVGGTYADPSSIGPDQRMEIAVNAVIAGVISTVKPDSSGTFATNADRAAALWKALSDPAGASGFLTFAPAISPNVSNLLTAAGLSL